MVKAKVIRIGLIILAILIAVRIALPYVLLSYMQHRVKSIPNYQIKIDDLSLRLYRGEIDFNNITVKQLKPTLPVPLFTLKQINIGISWFGLLRGKLSVKTSLFDPVINISLPAKNAQKTKQPAPEFTEVWGNIINALFPLPLTNVHIENGELHFLQVDSQPRSDWYIKKIQLQLNNEKAIVTPQKLLPSSLIMSAQTMDGAPIDLKIYFNPLADYPTFKINASLTGMQIKPLNPLLHYYTKVEVTQGSVDFFMEAAAKNGKLVGYAKPLIKNLKIKSPDENASFLEHVYKHAAQLATKILKNNDTKIVGAKIEIKGDVNQPNTKFWSVIWSLLKNSFIQALLPELDNSVSIKAIELK